jgi:hypothetical protein
MLAGVMLLWFVLATASVLFVAIDIRTTPESPVMKWGFVLVSAFIGVVGAFLYVLGCREPLPGTHERYVAAQWRQTLGSTMHYAAGDGVGILAGAVLASVFGVAGLGEILLEYGLGFGFGWLVFQALFMRDMAGGSHTRSLASTFIPELLSMNLLMAGMAPTMMILRALIGEPAGPATPAFWFVMSIALLVGFAFAYPMNWWLVGNHFEARDDDRAAEKSPARSDNARACRPRYAWRGSGERRDDAPRGDAGCRTIAAAGSRDGGTLVCRPWRRPGRRLVREPCPEWGVGVWRRAEQRRAFQRPAFERRGASGGTAQHLPPRGS